MFGEKFFENAAILFTRWSYYKKDIRERIRDNATEYEKKNQFNE